jgi:hypothetical protein
LGIGSHVFESHYSEVLKYLVNLFILK